MERKIRIIHSNVNSKRYYGIEIEENGNTETFSAVTESEEKAEQLKRNLADSDISAVHIRDIIRDFITEEACDKLIASSLL